MNKRPYLDKKLDSITFRNFYYLKEELVEFCRKEGLPTLGSKIELSNRIAHYLDTGKILSIPPKVKQRVIVKNIDEQTEIEANFACSEIHRAFFKERIGKSFSFNVDFQKWLKANTGKTYLQAIEAYHQIIDKKKNSKTSIDKQFEYNTYIRDFFKDNKGLSLEDAIKCWKYKKSQAGNNCYEKYDLKVLKFKTDSIKN